METVLERVKKVVAKTLDKEEEEITPDSRFREDLEADSFSGDYDGIGSRTQ